MGEVFWLSEVQFERLLVCLPTDTRGVARVDGLMMCFPRAFGHRFHEHSATDSMNIRPPIPR